MTFEQVRGQWLIRFVILDYQKGNCAMTSGSRMTPLRISVVTSLETDIRLLS
jgi:hypothetical protein